MKLLGVVHIDPNGYEALLDAIRKLKVDWVSFELLETHEPDETRGLPEEVIRIIESSADDVDIDLFKRIVNNYDFEARVRDRLEKCGVSVYNSDASVPFLLGAISNALLIMQNSKRNSQAITEESRLLFDNLFDIGLSGRIAFWIATIFEASRTSYGDIADRDYAVNHYVVTRSPLAVRYRDYQTAKKLRRLALSNPNGLHVCGLMHMYGSHKNLAERLSDLEPSLHLLSEFY